MRYFLIILIISFVVSLLPLVTMRIDAGKNWNGIINEYVDDSLYYYARIKEIKDGYPFIGNPYFSEHKNERSISTFASDWISSLPLVLGFPIIETVIINNIVWTNITNLLSYALFRKLRFTKFISLIGSLITFLQIERYLIRPVYLQVVYPSALFFLWAFVIYWQELKVTNRRILILSLALSLTLYTYPYLFLITASLIFAATLYLFFKKKREKFIGLFKVIFIAFLISLPQIYYSLITASDPRYWESLRRITLTFSHIPSFFTMEQSVLIVSITALFFLVNRKIKAIPVKELTILYAVALLFSLASSMVTGKEMETAGHINKFLGLWLSLLLIFQITLFGKDRSYRQILLLITIGASIYLNFLQSIPVVINPNTSWTRQIQDYKPIFNWLSSHGKPGSVVWGDLTASNYIPIYTTDYVLYAPLGILQLATDEEIEERYLVSKYRQELSLASLETDYRQYGGSGKAIHDVGFNNYKSRICTLAKATVFGIKCPRVMSAAEYKGKEYFLNLLNKYELQILPNINNYLHKYSVRYILLDNWDKTFLSAKEINEISNINLVFHTNRFSLYERN